MVKVVRFLVVAAALFQVPSVTGVIAYAHSDEVLARMTAPNGGVLKSLGPYHVEFVETTGRLTIYVTDHGGKPIDLADVRADARRQYIHPETDPRRKSVTVPQSLQGRTPP